MYVIMTVIKHLLSLKLPLLFHPPDLPVYTLNTQINIIDRHKYALLHKVIYAPNYNK